MNLDDGRLDFVFDDTHGSYGLWDVDIHVALDADDIPQSTGGFGWRVRSFGVYGVGRDTRSVLFCLGTGLSRC